MMDTGMEGGDWKGFMRRHWGAAVVLVIGAVLAVAGGVYVFWWFTQLAQSSGLVPSSLGLWTTGNLIAFILNAIFWEILLVGIPVIIGVAIAWLWWKRLPLEERMGHHWGRRARRTGSGGGFGLFFFILFAVKVWLDGNWNVPIANFSLNYVVGSLVTILVWVAVIFGIPAAIFAAWWVRREMRKP
jgi:hypothetical protein